MTAVRSLALLGAALAVTACAIASNGDVERTTLEQQQAAFTSLANTGRPSAVTYAGNPFYGIQRPSRAHGEPLPAELRARDYAVTINRPITLADLAARLTEDWGTPVRVNDRPADFTPAVAAASPAAGATNPQLQALIANANGGGLPAPPGAAPASFPGPSAHANPPEAPTFINKLSGQIPDVLDAIAARYDADWSVRDKTIVFDRTVVRVLHVAAGPTTTQVTANIAGATTSTASGTGGGAPTSTAGTGASSGTSQTTATSGELDPWTEVDKGLAALLPRTMYYAARSAGVVVIVAPPSAARRAEEYIRHINAVFLPRIKVDVTAFLVRVSQNDDYGLNLEPIFNNASTGLQAALSGPATSITASGAGTLSFLQSAVPGVNTHWAGSQAMLRALSTTGRLADLHAATTVTQNNVLTPVQLTTLQDVLQGSSTASQQNVGAIFQSTTINTLTLGYAIQVLPRMVDDEHISVLLTVTNTDLTDSQDKAISSTESVTLTTRSQVALKEDVILASGETMAISGYEQLRSTSSNSGVGNPGFWLLGGEGQATVERTRLILLVTATVLPSTPSGSSTLAAPADSEPARPRS